MRVFVAGATGAIGRRLVPLLVAAGHEVVGLTRRPERRAELERLGARAAVGDALDAHDLRRLVRDARPDVVVNELTDLPQALKPRRLAEAYARNDRVRRDGSRHLLESARDAGARRIVLQSAAYWYAPGPTRPAGEEEPFFLDSPEPIGGAVRTMRDVETSHLAARGLDVVVLRYGMCYGPGTWYAREGHVGREVLARRYPVIGRGEGAVSFVHVDDAARATLAATAGPPGVYNVVDDEPAPNCEWPRVFAEALGARPPMRVPKALARLAAGRALVAWLTTARPATNRRAAERLGWRPAHATWRSGFRDGLGPESAESVFPPSSIPRSWR